MTTPKPVVFLVDEDPATREAIRRIARTMDLACRVFAGGQEFLDTFDRSQCGCLVTELRVTDVSGLRILERLIADGSTLPVIFVTAHGTVPVAVRAIRAGAFHFLEKPCHEQELCDIIQDAVAVDEERLRRAQRRTAIEERLACLTRKEEQVLRMIGEGKPNRIIAEELCLSLRTVEVRRNTLLKKLGMRYPEELVRLAMSVGNGQFEPQPQERCPLRTSRRFVPQEGWCGPRSQDGDGDDDQTTAGTGHGKGLPC
jgi:two-component system response regulator DctR